MLPNNLISLTEDPTLPDLLPEDILLNEFCINDFSTPLIYPDITEINRKLEQLTLETNTQSLGLAVEKAKRQRLQTSARQVKNDLALPCPELIELKNELHQMRDYQNAINYQLDNCYCWGILLPYSFYLLYSSQPSMLRKIPHQSSSTIT